MDSKYVRALREYQKIINQRNHLLKRIRDNFARLDELHFWDNEMVNQGATIISIRASAIDFLKSIVIDKYAKMSHENELVSMTYVPSFSIPGNNIDELKEKFLQLLNEVRTKELAIGQTMIGPHRDDIKFEINGMSAGRFGSRGQIRCVALALRFAEAHFMDISLGDSPIILLDDILSELDDVRRNDVLRSASSYQQVLLTTAVPIDQYLKDYSSNIFNIKNGRIAPQGTS
jgi:DNA replication and repair protein RecF